VLHGIAIARGQFLIVMDADLQHPPEAIPYLLSPLKQGDAEFVIGSRYVAGGTTADGWSPLRRLNSAVATLLARPFARRAHDPMSGFFALRRETYQRAARLNPLGYKIALELICKCRARRIMEVPIHFGVRTAGDSKLNLKQQFLYLRHLARLYNFAFPRTMTFLKAAVGGALGYALSQMTNPALAGVLTVLAATTLTFVTRNKATSLPPRRQLLDSERIFRFDELEQREQAA
jgi:dolichol-phosphate mannosyltransferase